ncbi:MAG: 30S ribosome-binding factor RbfA [Pseudanabaenaceae cyanobacterium]
MATDRRVARVAETIKREVGAMLMRDIKDDRVGAGMASITAVEVSRDLEHAQIFVSIYGTAEARAETMAGLAAATGFVRRELAQRLNLRRAPVVVFREDRSIEEGSRVLSLLQKLAQDRSQPEATSDG